MNQADPPEIRESLIRAERHLAAGAVGEVEAICAAVIAERPDHPGALTLLGAVAHRAGDMPRAAGLFARVEAVAPDDPRALVNHGVALLALNDAAAALPKLARASSIAPSIADTWFNLGRAYQDLERFDEAISAYERASALAPNDVQALNNLGAMLLRSGRADEAVRALSQAVRLRPNYVRGFLNLGEALASAGQADDAMACFRRVLAMEPGHEAASLRLAQELRDRGRLDEAEAGFRDVIARRPDSVGAWAGLGVALGGLRRLIESEAALRRAVALAPDNTRLHDDLLLGLNYRVDTTPERLLAEHRAWAAAHADPLKAEWQSHDNDRTPQRPLRIGLISGNFRRHPIGYFSMRLIQSIDRDEFPMTCYSTRARGDEYTDRIRAVAPRWVDVTDNDPTLAARVRADRIDILIDQDGHFDGNRLLVYARKPAPVQATWHGYPATTGMDAIDWVISDRHHSPPDADRYFVERIWRLPDGNVCYDPPPYAPQVNDLPALRRGFVTFAAFHNPSKISDECADLWARVMADLPGSRMILKYRGIDAPSTRAALAAIFATRGIDASRLDFEAPSQHPELLARYGDCDIALDSMPYSGSTTTCEALWMGVPVVTRPGGPLMYQRHSTSHLMNVGLPELVGRNDDDYVAIATGLARDVERLAALRRGLRGRMAQSPLCDGPRFARSFGEAMRVMWNDWLQRSAR